MLNVSKAIRPVVGSMNLSANTSGMSKFGKLGRWKPVFSFPVSNSLKMIAGPTSPL